MLCFTLLMLFFVSNNRCIYAKNAQISDILEDTEGYQRYVDLDKNLKHLVNRAAKMLLPYAMDANEHWNISASCKRDLFQLFFGIRNLQLSALKILDATGKIPAGILAGNVPLLGDYDECMSASVSLKPGNTVSKAQYCVVNIQPRLPKSKRRLTLTSGHQELVAATKNSSELTKYIISLIQLTTSTALKFGLCVPSGCGSNDLSFVLNKFGEAVHLNASVAYCDQQDYPNILVGKKIAIIILSIDVLLLLIGTSTDYYSKKNGIKFESTILRLVLCFSILSNFPKLISKKISSKSLKAVFGVRSLSLFYIVLLNECYYHLRFQLLGHGFGFTDSIPNFFAQIAFNGFLTVEVLFFLGGLLNCYCRMKDYEHSSGKFSASKIIIHRLWRIYPAYLFSMVIAYILPNSKGPMATFAKEEFLDNCKLHWWKNILFINNFFPFRDTCMTHTWFVAADMHLYLISLFTLPVLFRCAKKGIILHLTILIAGITATVIWAWHKDIPPSNIFHELEWSGKYKLWTLQSTTLPHIAPYFTGIIIGYILCKWKDVNISPVHQLIGWFLAATSFISMLFMSKLWNAGLEYTAVESAFYFGCSRFVYVLAVAWMVVCCVKGYGGIINYILSFKIWIPISRISYMMFLTFPILQMYYFANLKMVIDIALMTIIGGYLGNLVISIFISLVMVLMVESPFIAIEKILFKSNTEKKLEIHDNIAMNGSLQI